MSSRETKPRPSGLPTAIRDAVAILRAERGPLAARLDAIDLAIANVLRAYDLNSLGASEASRPRRRRASRRSARVTRAARNTAAGESLRTLLEMSIRKSEHGLSLVELRKLTPKVDGAARSKALQELKRANVITRAGNAWRLAA